MRLVPSNKALATYENVEPERHWLYSFFCPHDWRTKFSRVTTNGKHSYKGVCCVCCGYIVREVELDVYETTGRV
jgi:hypothetical protein